MEGIKQGFLYLKTRTKLKSLLIKKHLRAVLFYEFLFAVDKVGFVVNDNKLTVLNKGTVAGTLNHNLLVGEFVDIFVYLIYGHLNNEAFFPEYSFRGEDS